MVSFRFLSGLDDLGRRFPHSSPYYGGLWRKVLADRTLFTSFLVAASLHALGHAAMALAAGLLGSALLADQRLISSSFRVLSGPPILAFVGVLATLLKGGGATAGATLQSRLAQNVTSSV